MLDKLAQLTIHRPRRLLIGALLVVVIAGAAAAGLMSRLTMGGWDVPGSESDHAASVLKDTFRHNDPNLVLLVTDQRGVDDPAVATAGEALTKRLAAERGVSDVASYWSAGKPAVMRGVNGDKALITGHIDGDFDVALKKVKELAPAYNGTVDGLTVRLGGAEQMWNENLTQATNDATLADTVVFPLVLIILILIFGSVIAALLPLAVATVTIVGSMGIFWALTFGFDLSNFVLNTATFVGMGLAIDYSLLIVSRFREERRRDLSDAEAIRATVRTAGRTVVFSAVCVAVAFCALLVVPFPFFASLAIGGIATTLFAAAAAITIVPALIMVLGPRLEKLRVPGLKQRDMSEESHFWRRIATWVMRRPVLVSTVVLAVLVLMGLPALGMNLRLQDEQVLPPSAGSAQVVQVVRQEFGTKESEAIRVVAPGTGDPARLTGEISGYAKQLSTLPDVARVDSLAGSFAGGALVAGPTPESQRFAAKDGTHLAVIPGVDGHSSAGAELVRAVRAAQAPFPVLVGGAPAVAVDTFDRLGDALPLAIIVLVLSMFVLLFLLTGSVLLPIKAIALTTLSLTATFGALVFIFQDGHLRWLIGDFTVTGAIIWTVPIILFAMAFGLSMDYQVFIMSRIKEEKDRGKDNDTAVVDGLARTGRVVTYAALVISTVCAVWVTSGIGYMKSFGIGIPLAIILDATIVRGTLLPAFMKLLGNANWWAPRPLRLLHARFGLHEHVEAPAAAEPKAKVTT
ncbi:putative drug exporter of the RND superfamily [Amycolatopsis xylanica]|uniref:Putative drug exporter of the RND superfamily n=1 Tax=Amycolatopsis xylanica TaxID=589385 RepID=A0A1H3T990_9PSEU|nr:MMPL family transporter [Amycolatopsis xylanica]SDZ46650.1 putative drug exporter of the RND superfamily [Amycolatopsis xylanica]